MQSFENHDNSIEDENCCLLGYYTASSGNSVPTFWDNILVPSSRVKIFFYS